MATPRSELLPTRRTLLSRLRDCGDDRSWREFSDLYAKLLKKMARKRGLNDQEADEVMQETLIALAKTMPTFRYEPERCSFKSWLRHLLEKKVADQFRRRARASNVAVLETGDSTALETFENLPDPATLKPDSVWDEQWRQHLAELAIERVKTKVKPRQFQVFQRLAILNYPVAEVAAALEMNVAQVYLARHRVTAAVKKEIRALEKELG